MSVAKSEEIKIRVPSALKDAVKSIADSRFTSESEIVREAIIYYLHARTPGALQDAPSSASAAVKAAEDEIVQAVTHYGKKAAPKKKPVK